MKEKLVLAFSGGLDTSFCAKYLSEEKGFEVHSVIVNTGGFSHEELKAIEKKAYALGVAQHATLDVTDEYYQKCIRYMIFGNMLRNNTYPLSVSSERIFQAMAIVEYAKKIGAGYIAHGSTGAGNDQVRFDLVFQIVMPEVNIIAPIRELKLSRNAEIEYLKSKGVEDNWDKKSAYSINKGLWGTSIGGKETLQSHTWLPDEAFPSSLKKQGAELVELTFTRGEITAINGVEMTGADAIRELEEKASAYAVGRDTNVGDTIIGIKGRVGFEAAAPLILIKAHHLLEKHTLTKWQQYWKDQLSGWYGMLLHEAQYLEPVMRDIERFLESSQQYVSGQVTVSLQPYRFEILGVSSPHDLMNAKFAKYGEENNTFNAQDVIGFTKILGNQMKIWYSVNQPK
ncbi:MAG: argininosuccinate synthase [Bacteroidales bacterium]|nr:argininosuccinate synthase [Bacteroidales bacterium]MDD4646462.1 argininosuccinate synthase [Bacteroidales bacterium]